MSSDEKKQRAVSRRLFLKGAAAGAAVVGAAAVAGCAQTPTAAARVPRKWAVMRMRRTTPTMPWMLTSKRHLNRDALKLLCTSTGDFFLGEVQFNIIAGTPFFRHVVCCCHHFRIHESSFGGGVTNRASTCVGRLSMDLGLSSSNAEAMPPGDAGPGKTA